MGFLLKAITSKLAGPIFGALMLVALIGNGFQFFRVRVLQSELTDSKADVTRLTLDNATLKGNQTTLKAGVQTQNSAVAGIAQAAELSATKAKLAQAEREKVAAQHDAAAAAIAKLPPLPAGADPCAAASALIRTTLAGEHQK